MLKLQEGPTMAKRTEQGKSGQSNHTESRPQPATERRGEQEGPTMAKRTEQGKSGQSNHTESRPQRATERRGEQEGPTMAKRTEQGKSGQSNHAESRPQRATERRGETWSPVREGIVPLPSSLTVNAAAPSNAETLEHDKKKNELFEALVDLKIESVLYGPRKTRRLPVFQEICPDS